MENIKTKSLINFILFFVAAITFIVADGYFSTKNSIKCIVINNPQLKITISNKIMYKTIVRELKEDREHTFLVHQKENFGDTITIIKATGLFHLKQNYEIPN